tara:strand:+ start:449 stop:691 length:243 start_codon:yes stop_codon:yes gene_type:complete
MSIGCPKRIDTKPTLQEVERENAIEDAMDDLDQYINEDTGSATEAEKEDTGNPDAILDIRTPQTDADEIYAPVYGEIIGC